MRIRSLGLLGVSIWSCFFGWGRLYSQTPSPTPLDMSEWMYKKSVRIANTGESINAYQVAINIQGINPLSDNYIDFGLLKSGGEDIRFVSLDNNYINHWIAHWSNTTGSESAKVWVNLPSVSEGESRIYMYYGNSSAADYSNGDATFIFFDDFSGTTLDAEKWTAVTYGGSEVKVENGYLFLDANDSGDHGAKVWSLQTFDQVGIIFESDMLCEGENNWLKTGFEKFYFTSGNENLDSRIFNVGDNHQKSNFSNVYNSGQWHHLILTATSNITGTVEDQTRGTFSSLTSGTPFIPGQIRLEANDIYSKNNRMKYSHIHVRKYSPYEPNCYIEDYFPTPIPTTTPEGYKTPEPTPSPSVTCSPTPSAIPTTTPTPELAKTPAPTPAYIDADIPIVFTVYDGSYRDMCQINPDGTYFRIVTNGQQYHNPRWSYDGTKIVYQDLSTSPRELFVLDIASNISIKITDNASWGVGPHSESPIWSLNDQYVYYSGKYPSGSGYWNLYRVNADGSGNLVTLIDQGNYDWIPGDIHPTNGLIYGRRIIGYAHGSDDILFTCDSSGGAITTIVDNLGSLNCPDGTVRVSPDGSKILFDWRYSSDFYQVTLANIDGSNKTNISDSNYYERSGVWSPDGSRILFLSKEGSDKRNLWAMESNGSNKVLLYADEAYDCLSLDWKPSSSPVLPVTSPSITPDIQPTPTIASGISIPTLLTAASGADNITLSWAANPEPDIAGYNVYRSNSSSGNYDKINSALVVDTNYTDLGLLQGQVYFYKITAVSTSASESNMTDYVSATVGSIVVWMQDYFGDPGDEVTLLINANNATGVSNSGIDVNISYCVELLKPITQLYPGRQTVEKTALTNGFLLFDNSEIANGQLNISGLGSGMTITGDGHLFDIKFSVQSTASSEDYCEHMFIIVTLYDASANSLSVDYSDTAIFNVMGHYIRGDINGDGVVNSGDAILALKIACGELVPTWIQLQAGDINGDRVIDSADAILILRLAVGLPVNPPDGVGMGGKKLASSYTLTVGEGSGIPGETIRVPISIDSAAGLAGADLRVNYDSSVVTALGAYKTTLSGGFVLDYYVGLGWIDIAMSSEANLPSGGGDMVELEFRIDPAANFGASTLLNLSQKKLSRQYGENAAWESVINFDNGSITVDAAPTPTPEPPERARWIHDYDGDGTSDIGIFRGTTGLWAIRGITRAYFGSGTDEPVPGDYDGDGTTDVGIYRPASGLWALRGVSRVYFGSSSDEPVPGDYDGTGTWRAGIYRPASGLWAIRGITRTYFGGGDDEPVPGYYAGMVSRNIGIFRPASGLWAIRGVTRVYFGSATDGTVPGDYDGDGSWEAGIFRPSSGLWAARGVTRCYYGTVTDRESPGDYDGDGVDNVGIFRSSSGLWAIKGVTRTYFGSSADIPVTR